MVEGGRKLAGPSFIRALNPLMSALSLGPNHLPKAPPPDTSSLEARLQHRNVVGDTHIQTVTDYVVAVQRCFVSKPWN